MSNKVSSTSTDMKDLKIIRPNTLADLMGVSTVSIWRWEKSGNLPPRKKIGKRAVGWPMYVIKKWLENRPDAFEVDLKEVE